MVVVVDTDVVPNEGQHPPATGGQVELLATGPMCRYAEDLLPALRIMAGPSASKLRLDAKVSATSSMMGAVWCRRSLRLFCLVCLLQASKILTVYKPTRQLRSSSDTSIRIVSPLYTCTHLVMDHFLKEATGVYKERSR